MLKEKKKCHYKNLAWNKFQNKYSLGPRFYYTFANKGDILKINLSQISGDLCPDCRGLISPDFLFL